MSKKKKTSQEKKYLKTMIGVPLVFGGGLYLGGQLPDTMGTTITDALVPSAGMVGATVSIAGAGLVTHQLRKLTTSESRRRKRR